MMGKVIRSGIGIALLASLLVVWSTPAAAQGMNIQHYGPFWRGEYFNNTSLSGYPLLVRDDPAIDFDWGLGAPAPGLPADRFSVRWTRTLNLGTGDYLFSVTIDDGARLWVDGRLLIDQWHDQAPTTYTAHLFLSAGYHVIRMEYYENLERAVAKLSWQLSSPPPPSPGPIYINFWVDNDRIIAGQCTTLHWGVENVREVYLNGEAVVGHGSKQVCPDTTTTYTLHVVKLDSSSEYRSLTITVTGAPPPPTTPLPLPPSYPGAWRGEYFNNRYLQGPPVMVRFDAIIHFDWGHGSPGPGLGVDDFSVRWTRTVFSPEGHYRLQVMTDDGLRLRVDDRTVIDQWHDQVATVYTADVYLSQGSHTLVMEYYEHGDRAMAQLTWQSLDPAPGAFPVPSVVWRGEYFNNPYLSGPPVFTRLDKGINFNWGWGGPRPCLPSDNFSVRWTSEINFPTGGQYIFYARTDDGVRLWVDGRLVIDLWYDHNANMTYSGSVYLTPGCHRVKVEYYEHLYWAEARVWGQWGGRGGEMPWVPDFKWPNSCPFNWNDP